MSGTEEPGLPEIPEAPGPSDPPGPPAPPDTEWQRLAGWTAVVSPISTLRQAIIPAAVGAFGAGQASVFIGLAVAVGIAVVAAVVGLIPWLTTTYRVTSSHLEVRRGLLNRTTLTARLDRVRSVDLSSTLVHRVLGVTKVNVGTGVDEGQITLDSLDKEAAARLRRELLHAAPTPTAPSAASTPSAEAPTEPAADGEAPVAPTAGAPEGEVIAKLDWSWIKYAPLNLKNLAIALGGLAALFGALSDAIPWEKIGLRIHDGEINGRPIDSILHMLLIAIPIALVVAVLVWAVGSCVGYAVRWWDLQLVREQGREGTTLRRSFGLTSTRATTVEEAKVRGATSTIGPLIALAGGADLNLLTTGLDDNSPAVLPTAPEAVVSAVGRDILREDAFSAPLTGHGPRPRRRYWFRAVVATAVWTAIAMVPTVLIGVFGDTWVWWIPVVMLVVSLALTFLGAELRHRHLGHALTERYLVVRSGSYTAARTALQTDGIIGWRVKQTIFDRRIGLAQLTAMTAAGHEYVAVPDVPLETAVALAAAATPRTVSGFVAG
ncbi:putative membrane protein [Nocardioides albertanoniae]|uniref:Putative membrane protein n=1 Tax=Nocardioides albertanoniae TaxID=1175486 RepID=A0A543AB72_9ACTN|nr:PH domain-containing protein [Nocardioides albertanoniae]TQL69797.1 putative membrane protein [Nocardioides albertanoniae]